MRALVSIIIPTFNSEKTIEATLNSLLNQTYTNWEAIVVDDGSSKKSIEITQQIINKDSRFIFFQRQPSLKKGPSVCRNIGLQKASGTYIVFLDSDDLLAAHCLSSRVTTFNKYQENDFLVFAMQRFKKAPILEEQNELILKKNTAEILNFLILESVWQITSPIYKVNYIKKITGFNESMTNLEDLELAIRAIFFSKSYMVFQNIDSYYRNDENYKLKYSSKEVKDKVVASFIIFLNEIHNSVIKKEDSYLYKKQLVVAYKKIYLINMKDSINEYRIQNSRLLLFLSSKGYLNKKEKLIFYFVHNIISKFHKIKGVGVYRLIKYLYTLK